jgi:uncharacterized protein YkwD
VQGRGPSLFLLCLAVAAIAAPSAAPRGFALTRGESALARAINVARIQRGVPPLRLDARLVRAARANSARMLRTGQFSHDDFMRRFRRFRVGGSYFGENLAWGTGLLSAREAVQMWLASPGHRENLLSRRFRRIGIAAPVGRFGAVASATLMTTDFAG